MRRDTQRGAMLPIIFGATMLLAVLAFGGFTMLRVVVGRHEAQRAADSAVLVAANIVKHEGLPFDANKQGKAEAIARANSGLQLEFHWDPVQESKDFVDIPCHVTAKVPAPSFIFSSGFVEVRGSAVGTAPQTTMDQVVRKYPKLVLVLDFSGSMWRKLGTDPGPDGNGVWTNSKTDPANSYQKLLKAVNMLLDLKYDIKYGLVIFETKVIAAATVPIALGNRELVQQKVNANYSCPAADGSASCTTNSAAGLKEAHKLFDNSPGDEGRYILFVSDGQPNAEGPAIQEAQKLFNLNTGIVTIFTLHLVNYPTGLTALKNFMLKISGLPDTSEGEVTEDYYAKADSDAEIMKEFKRIGAALACQIGPLDPVPPNPEKMHIFIKAPGGDESVILNSKKATPPAKKIGNLWDDTMQFYTGLYYFYKADTKTLYVTPSVCDRVTAGEPVIIRFASPQLNE